MRIESVKFINIIIKVLHKKSDQNGGKDGVNALSEWKDE